MMSKEGFFLEKRLQITMAPSNDLSFLFKTLFEYQFSEEGGRSRKWIVVSFR